MRDVRLSQLLPEPLACSMAPFPAACALALAMMGVACALRAEVTEKSAERAVPQLLENPIIAAKDVQAELEHQLPSLESEDLSNLLTGDAGKGNALSSKLLTEIRSAWLRGVASSSPSAGCWEQLGGLLADLEAVCQEASPEEHYTFKYYEPALPEKDCAASAMDIFIYGQRLVEALQVPEEQVEQKRVSPELAPLVQSLYFLRSWLVPLATTSHSAMLWAGFWDGDPENRTTQQALFEFAAATDHETMHPSTELGRMIERRGELSHCYRGKTLDFMNNMWSFCSMSFIMGMKSKAQGTVVAVVNKAMEGQRALQQSVLFQHELPTLGVAAWGLGFWAPRVVVLDLRGTCTQTSPALRQQLLARLTPWWRAKRKLHWSLEDFARRSSLEWMCVDCPECRLDSRLAQHVSFLVEAGRGTSRTRAREGPLRQC